MYSILTWDRCSAKISSQQIFLSRNLESEVVTDAYSVVWVGKLHRMQIFVFWLSSKMAGICACCRGMYTSIPLMNTSFVLRLFFASLHMSVFQQVYLRIGRKSCLVIEKKHDFSLVLAIFHLLHTCLLDGILLAVVWLTKLFFLLRAFFASCAAHALKRAVLLWRTRLFFHEDV